MRDPNRIDPMLQAIGEYWHKHPDMRLGQIIDNSQFLAPGRSTVFYVEDEALMVGLIELEKTHIDLRGPDSL